MTRDELEKFGQRIKVASAALAAFARGDYPPHPALEGAAAALADALELPDDWEHQPSVIGHAAHEVLGKAVDAWEG